MITATWCEKRALIVGIPRRSTEWSTESSCTRVARWISSTTAASVTVRASSAPDARWLSSSRVGRNSFPFIRSRCSLTRAMMGKSAAMMRRSSSATSSSSPATGRWISPSETGASCWLTSFRLGERPGPLADVFEPDVHREHPAVQPSRLVDVLIDALFEPGEHLLEVLLFVPGRLLVRDLHASVACRRFFLQNHGAQVDEIALRRRFVAHLHLRILRRRPLLTRGGRRLRRRRRGGREHRQRRLRTLVLGIVLGHALIHGPGLVREVLAQQRVRQLQVRIDQHPLSPGFDAYSTCFLRGRHPLGSGPRIS